MSRLIDADIVKNMHKRFIGYLDEDMITRLNIATDAIATGETWISVEDKTPEEYGEYLVAWLPSDCPFPDTETCFIAICEYEPSSEYDHERDRFKGDWLVEDIDYMGQVGGINVYAWMELPKQYVIGKEQKCSRLS